MVGPEQDLFEDVVARAKRLAEEEHERALAQRDENEILEDANDAGEKAPPFPFERIATSSLPAELRDDLDRAIDEDELDFYVTADLRANLPPIIEEDSDAETPEASKEEPSNSEAEAATAAEPAELADLVFRITNRSDDDNSDRGGDRFEDALAAARNDLRLTAMTERGFPIKAEHLATLETQDAASEAESSGVRIGRFLTAMLILLLLSGGSVVAMDSLAGEKERGTLETLLTTAARRTEIVAAKTLSILLVGLFITFIQVLNLLVWISVDALPLPEGITLSITPGTALLLLVLYLPLAALVSFVLLLISGYAKTYKEAQLLFFPVFLLMALPALVVVFPNVELRSALVLLPIANLSIAVKEVLAGSFDWLFLGIAWVVNVLAALLLARFSIRALSSERLITANDFDSADLFGGPPLFARRVYRWFAVLWAVFLMVQLNVGTNLDIRTLLSLNMAMFFLSAVWMIRHYRLGWKNGFAIRWPKPAVWLAVLFGAPAGLVVASMVGLLSARFMEIPDDALEQFAVGFVPDYPIPVLLFFFAVLPAVFEELAFRGVLLHGVRRRLKPVPTALVVGVIFGLFHVDLFRLLPTAFLGVLMATVTLLTGSVFPAILWHFINNALAVTDQSARFEAMGDWIYPGSVVILLASLALIWWARTPYPDPKAQDLAATGDGERRSMEKAEKAEKVA